MSHRTPPPASTEFDHLLPRRLDWSELDVLGHANNARYFTWFEEARMHFFRSRGIPVDGAQNWGPILAQTECQFLAPVTWPAQLLLAADVIKVGKSSMTMRYAVFIETETEPRCVAMGSGVIVLINYQSGDKLHIDDALRDRLLGSSPPRAEVR